MVDTTISGSQSLVGTEHRTSCFPAEEKQQSVPATTPDISTHVLYLFKIV